MKKILVLVATSLLASSLNFALVAHTLGEKQFSPLAAAYAASWLAKSVLVEVGMHQSGKVGADIIAASSAAGIAQGATLLALNNDHKTLGTTIAATTLIANNLIALLTHLFNKECTKNAIEQSIWHKNMVHALLALEGLSISLPSAFMTQHSWDYTSINNAVAALDALQKINVRQAALDEDELSETDLVSQLQAMSLYSTLAANIASIAFDQLKNKTAQKKDADKEYNHSLEHKCDGSCLDHSNTHQPERRATIHKSQNEVQVFNASDAPNQIKQSKNDSTTEIDPHAGESNTTQQFFCAPINNLANIHTCAHGCRHNHLTIIANNEDESASDDLYGDLTNINYKNPLDELISDEYKSNID